MNMPIYYTGTAIFIPTWLALIAAVYLAVNVIRSAIATVSAIKIMFNSKEAAKALDEAWRNNEESK